MEFGVRNTAWRWTTNTTKRPVRNTVCKLSVPYIIVMSSNDVLQSYFLLSPVYIHRPEKTDLWKSSWNMTGISEKKYVIRPIKPR